MGEAELFRQFDHAGDIGIELTAPSKCQLFANGIIALGRLMVGEDSIGNSEHRRISVSAGADSEVMHDLLATALNVFFVEDFIWSAVTVSENDGQFVAELLGEPFDPERHRFLTEIKAVTYHQLTVEEHFGVWRARVIFDV